MADAVPEVDALLEQLAEARAMVRMARPASTGRGCGPGGHRGSTARRARCCGGSFSGWSLAPTTVDGRTRGRSERCRDLGTGPHPAVNDGGGLLTRQADRRIVARQ